MTGFYEPASDERVRIVAGRWRGRIGVFAGWSTVQSGQLRLYPTVRLDDGRARNGEVVRVSEVEPIPAPEHRDAGAR